MLQNLRAQNPPLYFMLRGLPSVSSNHLLLSSVFSYYMYDPSDIITYSLLPFCVRAAGLRAPVLPSLHPDPRPQLRDYVRLPGPQAPEGGAGDRMCPLWLQGMCQRRLTD